MAFSDEEVEKINKFMKNMPVEKFQPSQEVLDSLQMLSVVEENALPEKDKEINKSTEYRELHKELLDLNSDVKLMKRKIKHLQKGIKVDEPPKSEKERKIAATVATMKLNKRLMKKILKNTMRSYARNTVVSTSAHFEQDKVSNPDRLIGLIDQAVDLDLQVMYRIVEIRKTMKDTEFFTRELNSAYDLLLINSCSSSSENIQTLKAESKRIFELDKEIENKAINQLNEQQRKKHKRLKQLTKRQRKLRIIDGNILQCLIMEIFPRWANEPLWLESLEKFGDKLLY
ncbi:hypothetical protein E3Q23_02419 [Wallemia mellicola]|uniref:Uncharacterized protein n=1 Tax=Wallemia mellicola TaxID=1708541 RepID=A0A4T0SQA6_9BASI|nr:hypothetical protein E3Q24_02287 [Wallemia mellicola]TIB75381.1 hypothetical protein E3Q23_02419 [Wallemia mellicola]TIC22597.1 hypothetical protein E3Q12_02568 [Wallemia mellicola]TIC38190.1 hypothetical protein E3Q09_00295 [Wallemia mellicola]TIC54405.1 hypothetical protein E3Q04_02600 [Wallemia mellicola]